MAETTLMHSPQDSQRPEFSPDEQQRSSSSPRSVVYALILFVLSFAVLFVGPVLALRLMTDSLGVAVLNPDQERHGYLPDVHAAGTVTTVVFQQGKYPTSAYAGAKDVYINRWRPTTNFANEARLVLGQSRAYRPLVYFDLTAVPAQYQIPPSAKIISAQLGLYCYARNLFNEIEAQVYQVKRPWNPQQATWIRATATDNWGIEGCDDPVTDRYENPASSRVVFERNAFHYFDVTSIVQNWVSDPTSNKGFILIGPDPAVIYYYYSSEDAVLDQRPKLIVTWTIEVITPTPTKTATPGPSPTPTRTPTPTTTPPAPPLELDNTSVCYSHTPPTGVWQSGTAGGYGSNYEYETTGYLTATARWAPCLASPLPADGMYDVQAHWSVHSARPVAVPYEIHYYGGSATVNVNQTKNANGDTVPDYSPSGWRSLGVYPFRAGTYTTTGEYVELNTSSAGDTCADAVRWVPAFGVPGPPYTLTISAEPSELPSDGASTSTIVVTVTDMFGNMVADGTMVGLTTTLGALPYAYAEAESAAVTKLGTWSTNLNSAHSGGAAIYSDTPGDEAVWTFWGEAVSLVYFTDGSGGVADVSVDGYYVTTINFASAAPQFRVERQLVSGLAPGWHTVRVRNGGGVRIWLDAFRAGASTVNGVVTTMLTAPTTSGNAVVRATALGAGLTALSASWPYREVTVSFPGPSEVWVDDDYCSTCFNDGHRWNYDAFKVIQDGVNKVLSGGIVHVAAGIYTGTVTIAKPLTLWGAGSDYTVVDGTDAPGSRGFYVDRADSVTILGFKIRDFETGIYLRGTGSAAGPRVYDATIVQNKFESNNAGSNSYALRGSYVYTSTICSNDITLGYHGIYLDNTYGTIVCYNNIYNNQGFGVKINVGNDNSIDNNNIHDNQNVGIELEGSTQRNGVYGNVLHDLWWDGVLVNGSAPCSVQVLANVLTRTNQTWLDASGVPPDGNHNHGAIVLMGISADSEISDNRVIAASNAEGNRTDAAGILLSGNTGAITIEKNLIQGCTGNGIYISATGGNPVIHGNSIYGNGRFGLYNNQPAVTVDAEGNWWGCNVPVRGATPPRDIYNGLGTNFDWSPPISLTLSAAPTLIPANGIATSTITAIAAGGGYNILDGTLITFTSDLSTLVFPGTALFGAGQANTTLRTGTLAGTAMITGSVEPGRACGSDVTSVILAALAPHSIAVTAYPTSIPVGGSQSVVTATVRDIYGNFVPNIAITFTSNALGGISPATGKTVTNTGAATTTFTSGWLTGVGIVTATAGTTLTASTNITITAGPPCDGRMAIIASPPALPANGVATSTITVVMSDCVGYPVPDGTMVGFQTSLGSILDYQYVEAESSNVISTGWTIASDPSASGGARLETSSVGAAAYWSFRGQAVSLIYLRYPTGGTMRVRVDGGAPVDINLSGSTAWIEQVIATNLDPAVIHQIEVTHQSGTIWLDAFRSGAVTSGGTARATFRAPVLPITDTAKITATSRLDGPVASYLTATVSVVLSQTNIVWVDDDWTGLPDGTPVSVPGGTAQIGHNAFITVPRGVDAVQAGGTVYVLTGTYTLPVNITKTLNLLGTGGTGTTVIDGGSLATPGITVTTGVNNVVIDGFRLANWATGIYIEGPSNGLDISHNVFTNCTTLAISGAWVTSSRFTNNEILSGGSGIKLDTVNNSILENNYIHDTDGFGLWILSSVSTSTGNVLSYNNLHDLSSDGIIVDVNCVNTSVLSNTVRTTNLANTANNEGGIVLYNTTNTIVEHNTIYDVSDAGGSSTDTAGIWVGGTDSGAVIRYNQTINNANDGLLLVNFSSPPEIHCNHIYGNGRFGIRNNVGLPTVVNAEGNWWGRNTPTTGIVPPRDIYTGLGANVDYTPRITLSLTAATTTIYVGDPAIAITATGCGGGCCLLDTTPITFTTDLGGLGSTPTSTVLSHISGGQAIVMFTPGPTAGVATITGRVPNNGLATTMVTIKPQAPALITVTALPASIPVGGAITSAITATVRDMYGNLVEDGTLLQITSTLGSTVPPTNTTASGVATSTLYAGPVAGMATVRASWVPGPYVFGTAVVEITAGPPYTITSLTADPSSIPANGIATSRITATVVDQFGNFVPDGTMVGFTATAGSLIYDYAEAEDATKVITAPAGSWTVVNNPGASGGQYIEATAVGASAQWNFRGQAVSLRYARNPTNGRIRVQVDGDFLVIDTSGPDVWHEEVLFTGLSEAVTHTLSVTCLDDGKPVRLDVFRSGATTSSGRALAILTSDPLPPKTAIVYATGVISTCPTCPMRTVTVQFLAPSEVWVDDDYCNTCENGGHLWGFDAFSNIPDGITAVRSGGTVHVLDGVYTTTVTIGKPLYLDGAGSSSTTFLVGPGSGNGIRVTSTADGTTIEGFAIRNFSYGIYLDGRSTNSLQSITVTNNVITGCVTGAITATYVNSGTFADNALHHNSGFGLDLYMSDDNTIINNYIYDNTGFGLRVYGASATETSDSNLISLNTVYDMGWDGIRVGPRVKNTSVLTNTIFRTNQGAGGGFDLGGIALDRSTDTHVEGNTISYVQDGGGSLANTAGLAMDNSNTGAIIQKNLIRNNVSHGIWISNDGYTAGSPPEIHSNSIYANGKFGIYNNVTPAVADAEGNWWGRNTPTEGGAAPPPRDIFNGLGANVDYDPPIRLTLTRAPTAIVADGVSTSTITATMRSSGPVYSVLDGTLITLTTSLGDLGAPQAVRATLNGQTTAILRSATISGTAYITATTPSAGVAYTTVQFNPGPPFTITISAAPTSVWIRESTCRPAGQPYRSTIAVTVTDQYGNPCVGQTVSFTVGAGFGTANVTPTLALLNADGYTTTLFSSGNVAGTILVTATAGTVSRSVPIQIMPCGPRVLVLTRSPEEVAADGVSTATITATVYDTHLNPVLDGTMVGFTTTNGTLFYDYAEAEDSSKVERSVGDWLEWSDGNASGGKFIYTDTPGAWVHWTFTGSAVSLIYIRDVDGGSVRPIIDGVPMEIINLKAASTEYQRETVLYSGLDPSMPHIVQIECITGRVRLDALRSGTTTTNGVATAVLTSGTDCVITATVTATAVEHRLPHIQLSERPQRSTTVVFECADLAISKEALSTDVLPDQLVNFTIVYTNTRTSAQATNTLITDTLPSRLLFISSASSPNLGMPENPRGNEWVWRVGNLQPRATGVITLTARRLCTSTLGLVTNTVTIGSLTDEAIVDNNTDDASVNFILGPPYTVTVTASQQSIPTDSYTTIRITVTDMCGNPVPTTTVYITTNLGAFNSAGTLTSTTRTTNISGATSLTFWSRPPLSGTATISATAGPATGVGYVFIGVGPARQCVVVANPPAIPADGLSTSTLSARVLDTGGNPVPDGFFVGFTTSLGSMLYGYVEESQVNQSPPGSWSTAFNAAASGGSYIYTTVDGASVYWNFFGNGVSIIYVQYPGGGIGDVSVDGNPVGSINMNGSTVWRAEKVYTWAGSPTAAHTLRLTHRAGTGPIWMDAFRSGVTTYGGQAVALLTSTPFTGTAIVGATGVAEATGFVTATVLPSFTAVSFEPADVLITKTVQPRGQVTVGEKVTFTLTYQNTGPITATNVYIDDSVSDALSGDWLADPFFSRLPITVTPYIHYQWPMGAVGAGQSGVITFGGTINSSRYWPPATVFTNTAVITTSTADQLIANNRRDITTTIVSGMAFSISLTATPDSIPVGGATSTLRAVVRDPYGNPVPNGTLITFTTNLGGFPTATQYASGTSNGVATAILTSGPLAGTAQVTATLGLLLATAQVRFTPLEPFTITVTANPTQIAVGGSTSIIEAVVVDRYGNWVADGTSVSFATSAGSISPQVVSTLNGRASTVLISGAEATTATVTATAGSARGTTTVRFVPGMARVTIGASPLSLKVGEISRVTVTARDQYGNLVSGAVVMFTTSLGEFLPEGTMNATRTTGSDGRATVDLRSTIPGTAIVRGTIGVESAAIAITFDPGDPYRVTLTVQPTIIPVCGFTATARAEVRDRYGNLVRDGTMVYFEVSPPRGARIVPADGAPTTNGVAVATITSGMETGGATVRARALIYGTLYALGEFGVEFQAGPPDRVVPPAGQPLQLKVGGRTMAIRVQVVDCGGHGVVANTPVTFTIASGEGLFLPQRARTYRTVTLGEGWAEALLESPNQTGSATLVAAAGQREATIVVQYIPDVPFEMTVTADPMSIPANGVSTSTIVAEIKDFYGNHVADRTAVVFSTNLGRFTTGSSYTAFTVGGRASARLTSSTTPGLAQVVVLTTGVRREIYVDFYLEIPPTPTPTPIGATWLQRLPIIIKNYRRY